MKLTKWPIVLVMCAVAAAGDAPRGTVPKGSADQYPAHAVQEGASVGAVLLTAKDVRQTFSPQVNECCIVVEVALYPQKDGMMEVSLNDFALRVVGQDIATKPSSAEVVAAKLYRPRQDEPRNPHDVTVSSGGSIGYESGGIDPVTGQRRSGGVVTSAGVGVGVGSPEPNSRPDTNSEADRRAMVLELREKGLPEGDKDGPVAGYVYFAVSPKKNRKYQVEYNWNGSKVVLPL